MTTHYDITEPCFATLRAEVDRITAEAVEAGRTYRIQTTRNGDQWNALITVYPKEATQ